MTTFANTATNMQQNYLVEPVLEVLENGGLILYPTDTIWGIGCDATNPLAVSRLLELKQCAPPRPLVLLADALPMLKRYVHWIHPRVETLLHFHTRPLTVVYDRGVNLPDNVLASDGSVAIRISLDPFCTSLIGQFGKPLVATAACLSNQPYPSHFGEVSSAIIQGVDFVVKYRQMDKEMRPPSVIARLSADEELVFLRE